MLTLDCVQESIPSISHVQSVLYALNSACVFGFGQYLGNLFVDPGIRLCPSCTERQRYRIPTAETAAAGSLAAWSATGVLTKPPAGAHFVYGLETPAALVGSP